jgi:hypothetical protein
VKRRKCPRRLMLLADNAFHRGQAKYRLQMVCGREVGSCVVFLCTALFEQIQARLQVTQ